MVARETSSPSTAATGEDVSGEAVTTHPEGEMTKLEAYLKAKEIRPVHLALHSEYSRQHLLRVRMGRMEPTRKCMKAIVAACRRLTREQVSAHDLFDLE
jgi:hypothetical protein